MSKEKRIVDDHSDYPDPSLWIKVSERFPDADKPVIVHFINVCGNWRIVRARYIPPMTIEASYDDFDCDVELDYDEDKNQHYLHAGWIETNECEDINWYIEGEVTHWMPLPRPPK